MIYIGCGGEGLSLAGIGRTYFGFLVLGFKFVICFFFAKLSILEIGGQMGDLCVFLL